MDHRDPTHESGGDKAGEVANDPSTKSDHGGVPTVTFGEHLVGEPSPGFPGFVGLAGRDRQDIQCVLVELFPDYFGVLRTDVGISDQGVAMRRGDLAGRGANLGQKPRCDPDDRPAESDLAGAYQVTSPAPVRTFATRASMKRRSDRRFR